LHTLVPLNAVIMTVDEHEVLLRVLNRGLFLSVWVYFVHDLAVKSQAMREFFILAYFAATWKRILICFATSRTVVYMLIELYNDWTRNNLKNRHYASITHDQNQMY